MVGNRRRAKTDEAELTCRCREAVGHQARAIRVDIAQIVVHVVVLPELAVAVHLRFTAVQQELAIKGVAVRQLKLAIRIERGAFDFRNHRLLVLERVIVVQQAFRQKCCRTIERIRSRAGKRKRVWLMRHEPS